MRSGLHAGVLEEPYGQWLTYTPSTALDVVFDFPNALSGFRDDTLMEALRYRGGPGVEGAAQILLRAGVAALLNSIVLNGGALYPYHYFTTDMVVTDINWELTQDRQTMLDYAAFLDLNNNLGCPLN